MSELIITNKDLNDEYLFLPNSKNVIIKNLTIKLETDEINLKMFSETKIELLKKDPNIGPSGEISEYLNYGYYYKTKPIKNLESNKYGYYCSFDTNGKKLENVNFTITLHYDL